MVRVDTSRVEGVALERIPTDASGRRMGMALTRWAWKKLYFLAERKGWKEDNYFEMADRLIRELFIDIP